MRGWLLRMCDRLARWLRSKDPALTDARQLITWAETLPATPPEVKRQEVEVRLRQRHPDRRGRDLNWLIESVLQETR